jgi:hypothetical protein
MAEIARLGKNLFAIGANTAKENAEPKWGSNLAENAPASRNKTQRSRRD